MNNLNVEKIQAITRINKLEKEEQKTSEKLEKIQKDIKEIKDECSHEVIVNVDYSENLGGYESSHYLVCLFCGATFSDTRYIDTKGQNLSVIDMQKYGDLLFLSDEDKVKDARTRYIDVCKNHIKQLSKKEVAEEVQKSINSDYEKYKKLFRV